MHYIKLYMQILHMHPFLSYSLLNVHFFLFFFQKIQEDLTTPIIDFPDDAELFSGALLHSSEVSSCSGNGGGIDPNCAYEEGSFPSILSSYYPSMDDSSFSALMEAPPAFDIEAAEFLDCFKQPPPPFLSMEEQQQQQQQLDDIVAMAAAADAMMGNSDQQYNGYSHASMANLSGLPTAPPPYPQQSLIQSIYNGEEPFLPPMSSAAAAYLTMDAGMDGLYQGGMMGLPPCSGGGQGQGFIPSGIVPMQLPDIEYQNMAVGIYNLQDSFQQNGYGSTNMQLLGDRPLQQQQQLRNDSLVVGCSNPTPLAPDISTLEEPIFKVGRASNEERKVKIHRYIKKRNERNFSKKIKYACRKTLADSRPRVRGRFAKNEELVEVARTSTSNLDYEANDGVAVKDEDFYDSADILAHITGVNSFKCNSTLESWM